LASRSGSNDEIKNFCETKFAVTFPLAAKLMLWENAHPFYKWAAYILALAPAEWNFHKYLVDKNGKWLIISTPLLALFSGKVKAAIAKSYNFKSSKFNLLCPIEI